MNALTHATVTLALSTALLVSSASLAAGGTWGGNPTAPLVRGEACTGGTWGGNPEVVLAVTPGVAVYLENGGTMTATATDCGSNGAVHKIVLQLGTRLVIDGQYQGEERTLLLDSGSVDVAIASPFVPGNHTYFATIYPESDAGVAEALEEGGAKVWYEGAWSMDGHVLRWDNPGSTALSVTTATHY